MNLKTFFQKFELFADATDAVVKMRELVLDLAVKGKLTDRDVKKELVEVKYADEPSSEDLPVNWRLLNFGKFCDIQGGNQPPKSQFSDQPRPGYVRMFQIRDLGERPVPTYISEKSTNRFCRDGEILIGRYGASVGKVFWAQDGAYNVALAKFIFPDDSLLPKFAFWVLKSDFFQAEIADASRSAQAGFNKGDLSSIDFPLPPLAEQKRIVAKVDELMTLCDRLEAQQQEREARHAALARASLARFADAPTPANLDFLFHKSYAIDPADLRKSILTLAVQGKLVPQDPNDEPALALLARIAAHKAKLLKEGKLRGSTTVAAMAAGEVECELPPSWTWVRFGEIMINRDGERIPVSKEERQTKAKKYDYYGASGVIDKIDGYLFDKPLLLIGEDGANLINRSTPIAFIARGEYWVNNHAHVLDGISEGFLRFIELHINSINLEKYVTGTAQPKMNQAKMNSIPIALPPLAEQCRIVAKVDQLMALVDQLETQLATARDTGAALMEALVAQLTAPAERDGPPPSPAVGKAPSQKSKKSKLRLP